MEMLKNKKILTFDCYGTLIDWESGILNSLKSYFSAGGLTDDEILTLFAHTEYKVQNQNSKMKYEQVLRTVVKNIGSNLDIKISEEKAIDFGLSVRNWMPFSDTIATLHKLSSHFHLIIVSNIDNDSIAATKKLLNIEFFKTYTAEDIGAYKPDLKVFQYVFNDLKKDGFNKNDILHVAESLYHDHIPAKKMEFDSVWINRRYNKTGSGATPNVGHEWIPTFQFNDLSSFADWALL